MQSIEAQQLNKKAIDLLVRTEAYRGISMWCTKTTHRIETQTDPGDHLTHTDSLMTFFEQKIHIVSSSKSKDPI